MDVDHSQIFSTQGISLLPLFHNRKLIKPFFWDVYKAMLLMFQKFGGSGHQFHGIKGSLKVITLFTTLVNTW